MLHVSRLGRRVYDLIASPAVAYTGALVLVVGARRLLDPRDGVLALAGVFEPYLFLPLAILIPLALRRGAWAVRTALAVGVLLWAALYAPGLLARPVPAHAAPGGVTVQAASWNAYAGAPNPQRITSALHAVAADVVALEEFGPAEQAVVTGDETLRARYPYQILRPRSNGTLGMALLSAYPIREQGTLEEPPVIWALLDLGGGRTLRVVAAHPLPAGLRVMRAGRVRVPAGFEPALRDAGIATVRATIAPWLAAGEPVLVAGDFNVTEREPGYRDAAAGLLDAQQVVSAGVHATWQPVRFPLLGRVPLLRIDYMFSSPNLLPVQVSTDCTPRGSDHCLLQGTFVLPAAPGT